MTEADRRIGLDGWNWLPIVELDILRLSFVETELAKLSSWVLFSFRMVAVLYTGWAQFWLATTVILLFRSSIKISILFKIG